MDIIQAVSKGFLTRAAGALMLAGALAGGTLLGVGASPAGAQPASGPSLQASEQPASGPSLQKTISITDVSVTEGDSGRVDAVFTVTTNAATRSDTSVSFRTVAGSAKGVPEAIFSSPQPDADFILNSGRLVIPAGATSGTIRVPVEGDTRREANETFFVELSNPSGATLADARAQGTIVDDDKDTVVTISIADAESAEGTAFPNGGLRTLLFPVTLSNPSDEAVRVDFATVDGTAIGADCPAAGLCPALQDGSADFAHAAGTLTFAPGRDQQFVRVNVFMDRVAEGDESFSVRLSNAQGATIADGQARGIIRNDDN